MIKKINPEIIFKFKESYELSEEAKIKLQSIKQLMTGSTDSKNFKIKLKEGKITLNSNKWFRKRFTTCDERNKKKINGLLNKLTDRTYKKVINNILKLRIDSYENMDYLIYNIFNKIIYESTYIEYWIELLREVLFKNMNKWNFKNTHAYELFLQSSNHETQLLLDE